MSILRAGLVSTGLAALAAGSALFDAKPTAAQCSVFDRHPCNPSNCSVFQRRPCLPEFENPIGEDLRLTIESASDKPAVVGPDNNGRGGDDAADKREHKLNTIMQMFDALRTCWVPPPSDEARYGMQMTVRLSFKRSGELMGAPRVTYTTPDAPHDARDLYHRAITEALTRCTPMPFTAGLGGAVAGRPINIRYVDNRKLQQ